MNWFTKLKRNDFFFDKARSHPQYVACFGAKTRRPNSRYFQRTSHPRTLQHGQNRSCGVTGKRVSLTCDASTSISTHSYVTVTAHFINNEWQLKSHILQTSERSMFEAFCYCCWDVVDVEVPSRRQLHFFFLSIRWLVCSVWTIRKHLVY